ncbi:type I restriction endonuclease subunit S [Alteromonas mediterranea]|nr:type I restriction endonuclease subunit S [Alteromonas mediterranea]APD99631.1 type I restriction endonuclease subunit S [Alteromonas mediterranea]
MKTKSASGRGSSKKLELYGIKKLRELILELAVRGKLVSQEQSVEKNDSFLNRLNAKSLCSGSQSKLIVPTGWAIFKIKDLVSKLGSGSTPRGGKSAYVESGIPFLRSQNVWNDGVKLDDVVYISDEVHEKMSKTKVFPGDILLNITGASLGRTTVFPEFLKEANVSQHVTIVRMCEPELTNWVHLVLMSPLIQKEIWDRQVGMAIEGLSKRTFETFEIPIPPLNEQARIVEKVRELMSLCDQLESQTEASIEAHQTLVKSLLETLANAKNADELNESWQRISAHFDVLFTTEDSIDQLKQTILQLAVMGKLVKQDPNDEPASKLLERIATEKEQLIKDKKIKKQKPLQSISEDEKPFDIPRGWLWSRIGDIALTTDYGLSDKSHEGINGVPVLAMGQIQHGIVNLSTQKKVPHNVDSLPELYLEDRDLLYNRTNSPELVGKTGIYRAVDEAYTFASYLIRIRTIKDSQLPEFLNMNMQTPQFRRTQIEPHIKQQCGQANVNGTLMKHMLVAVPPEKEMEKILNVVNKMLKVCEGLSEQISKRMSLTSMIADTISNNN